MDSLSTLNEAPSPKWWHKNGQKIVRIEANEKEIRFFGPISRLTIQRIDFSDHWQLSWTIKFNRRENVSGTVVARRKVLLAAFGLSNETTNYSQWMLQRWHADAAEQGVFIRRGSFLNIPGPGTGKDGDCNMSLRVRPEFREMVRKLIHPST